MKCKFTTRNGDVVSLFPKDSYEGAVNTQIEFDLGVNGERIDSVIAGYDIEAHTVDIDDLTAELGKFVKMNKDDEMPLRESVTEAVEEWTADALEGLVKKVDTEPQLLDSDPDIES